MNLKFKTILNVLNEMLDRFKSGDIPEAIALAVSPRSGIVFF